MRLMTAAGLVLLCATTAAQTIPASETAKHVGEQGTVCGRVASEHTATSSRGTPTFINLDKPYPNQDCFDLVAVGMGAFAASAHAVNAQSLVVLLEFASVLPANQCGRLFVLPRCVLGP